MNYKPDQPFRPAQFVESYLVTAILKGTYPSGGTLPSERELAEEIGVTRPTLRETLQRLAREGWVTIRHGKPTMVNDYWKTGGLGMLGTIARYADTLPNQLILHLLECRMNLLPEVARTAAMNSPDALLAHLSKSRTLGKSPQRFAEFDWALQLLMARESGNLIYPLLVNDFTEIYQELAVLFYSIPEARSLSMTYYHDLEKAIAKNSADVLEIASEVMRKSIEIWKTVQSEHERKEK